MSNELYNIINYLVPSLIIFSFYGLGKRFNLKGIFLPPLVGLIICAIPVSFFVNNYTGLVKYIIFTLIVINLFLTLKFLLTINKKTISNINKYLAFVGFLVIVFMLLYASPPVTYLNVSGENQYFLFNRHYSYFSIQSQEMLTGDYLSRLKVANMYPYEWTRYHFHLSSVYGILQSFNKFPNVITYVTSQFILVLFLILSLIEIASDTVKFTVLRATFLLLVLVFGITYLDPVSWHLKTNGLISVLGIVLFTSNIIRKKKREQILLSLLILGMTIRLVPFVALIYAYLFLKECGKGLSFRNSIKSLTNFFKSFNRFEWLYTFLCTSYFFITFFSSSVSPRGIGFVSPIIYNDKWLFSLFSHKVFRFAFEHFGYSDYFQDHKSLQTFYYLSKNKFLSTLVILSSLFFVLKVSMKAIREVESKILWIYLITTITLSIFSIKLAITFLFIEILIYWLTMDTTYNTWAFRLITFTAFIFQLTGTDPVKGPMLMAATDVLLFGLLLNTIHFFKTNKMIKTFVLIILLTFSMNKNRHPILRITPVKKIDMTHLKRNDSTVNQDNFLTIKKRNPLDLEAISSILGTRLKYNESFNEFGNIIFTDFTSIESK